MRISNGSLHTGLLAQARAVERRSEIELTEDLRLRRDDKVEFIYRWPIWRDTFRGEAGLSAGVVVAIESELRTLRERLDSAEKERDRLTRLLEELPRLLEEGESQPQR